MTVMRRYLLIGALAFLAACDNGSREDAVPLHDVDYYLDHPDERKAMIKKCENDPGSLRDTPNCQNAGAAGRESFFQDLKDSLKSE